MFECRLDLSARRCCTLQSKSSCCSYLALAYCCSCLGAISPGAGKARLARPAACNSCTFSCTCYLDMKTTMRVPSPDFLVIRGTCSNGYDTFACMIQMYSCAHALTGHNSCRACPASMTSSTCHGTSQTPADDEHHKGQHTRTSRFNIRGTPCYFVLGATAAVKQV
jgi:hypothetical protein